MDKEVNHKLPVDDLKEVFKALEKVPIVQLKYSIAKTDSQEKILVDELP